MEIITGNSQQTKKIGRILGEEILKGAPKQKTGLVFALEGDLGSGKTTFIQGLAKGLGIKEKITSPTFVIMKKYNILDSISKVKDLYHIDCYRINHRDLSELGFSEIISQSKNMIIIEWADKVKDALPQESIWLKFKYLGREKRSITFF